MRTVLVRDGNKEPKIPICILNLFFDRLPCVLTNVFMDNSASLIFEHNSDRFLSVPEPFPRP
jgi:hypothetical protein